MQEPVATVSRLMCSVYDAVGIAWKTPVLDTAQDDPSIYCPSSLMASELVMIAKIFFALLEFPVSSCLIDMQISLLLVVGGHR